MRRVIRVLAVGGLVVAATWCGAAVQAQHAGGLNTTQTITISGDTKVLDLGTTYSDSAVPQNWSTPGFDASAWPPATPVSPDVVTCVTQIVKNWGGAPAYWGQNEGDYYLFRQSFTLSSAKNYSGSVISYGSSNGGGDNFDPNGSNVSLLVNGKTVDGYGESGFKQTAIGQYLKPGINVVGIAASPQGPYPDTTTSTGVPCSALTFTITLRITGIQTGQPSHTPATLSTILPGQNAALSGSSTLPFSWNRYAGARYYYLQFWLVNPAAGQRITSRSVTTYTARLTGTSYTLNTHAMPKGTYHWRMAAVSGSGKLLSPWTAEQTVTLK